jgi:Flp pilus assembly pilin Flp
VGQWDNSTAVGRASTGLRQDVRATAAVEYSLVLALLALTLIIALNAGGISLSKELGDVGRALTQAIEFHST